MLLAKDGIFPVTNDKNGNPLLSSPASGLPIPGTIQGEGKLSGTPSLFIRLAGCNLQCCWTTPEGKPVPCDTAYAAYQLESAYRISVEDIETVIRHNSRSLNHIVITGGEPFLQAKELKILCQRLKIDGYHLTIETNATRFDPEVAEYIDLFSLSPKLSGSQPKINGKSYTPDTGCINAFLEFANKKQKDFQLKFVFSGDAVIPEIKDLLSRLKGWKNGDILLMPLGGSPEIMRTNTYKTLEYCLRNNWRYCDRLHLSLFGDKQGV